MKLVDLNILLYAVNRDMPQHERIREWWENALSAEEPVALAWTVILGFLRLTTNPKVFPKPLSLAAAISEIDAWTAHPNIVVLTESTDHWPILRQILQSTDAIANLTTDAHLASLAIAQHSFLATPTSIASPTSPGKTPSATAIQNKHARRLRRIQSRSSPPCSTASPQTPPSSAANQLSKVRESAWK